MTNSARSCNYALQIYLRLSGDGCNPANASTWALQANAKHDRSRPVIDGAAAGGGWFIALLPEDRFSVLLPLVAGGGCGCTKQRSNVHSNHVPATAPLRPQQRATGAPSAEQSYQRNHTRMIQQSTARYTGSRPERSRIRRCTSRDSNKSQAIRL